MGFSSSSIKTSLWKTLFLPIFALALLSAAYLSYSEITTQITQFERNNTYLAEQSASASGYALLFNDRNLLNNNIQNLLHQRDVIGVSYYDAKGELMDSVGRILPPEKQLRGLSESYYLDDRAIYLSIAPVFYTASSTTDFDSAQILEQTDELFIQGAAGFPKDDNRELLGWVQVNATTDGVRLTILSKIAFIMLYTIVLLLLMAYLCHKYIQRIAKPWGDMSNTIRDIASGHYDKAREIKLPNELLQTKTDLEYISERLNNYRAELEEEISQTTKEAREHALQLEEKSAQLHIANKEATESNRLKSQFLANISHEVRTPLNAILGYTKLLQKDQLNPHQLTYVDTIAQSTNNLLATIGDILDFSKIEAGKLVLEPSDFNLQEIIDEVFHTLSSTLLNDDKAIDLIPSYSADVPAWVKGDAIRVRQILTNLVGNAIKFTQNGSVQVVVNLTSKTEHAIEISFQVIDTGLGIPSSKLNQLFKPFSQVDPSRSRNFSGTGLGLVITKKLIEQMNGTIQVSSEEGRGSNFYFSLTFKPSDKAEAPLPALHKHVLILEPNANYRKGITHFLSSIDVTYDSTSSIEEMIAVLHSNHGDYHCAILHIENKPVIANEAAQLIEYLQSRFNTPCVLMIKPSAQVSDQSRLHHIASQVLLKPLSYRKLHHAIANASLVSVEQEILSKTSNAPTTTTKDKENDTTNDLAGLNLLAVDDTPINLQLLGHWLEPYKINLSLAYSGQQALDKAQETQFDLILMDIQMPQMDGMETSQRLREMESYKDTPIIALTAHALAEEQQSMLASGMNAYLSKPINEEILVSTIREWCIPERRHSTQVIDHLADIFDMEKALSMTGNRVEAASELLDMLMESLVEDKRSLQHHYESENLEKLIATVHRIHGASKYSGTIEMTRHANFLETHLKELGFDEVEEVYEDFLNAITRLENALPLITWPQGSQKPEHNSAHPTS